ncbi:TAP binding protein like [Rhinolophus ferrumequinum]|uniref:TAP binding protein like n=1 Tax=Rhinolophus ferrumequinum TaxID=59479 RepID=A0A7J7WTJ1_RHIFE|nr:TAP binding protein like [Rhinolophus ferrumequinum]
MGTEEGWCLLLCLALSGAADTVNLVQVPHAEALLHADCSGKEVTCEISRYYLQARQEATIETAVLFITNVQVSGGEPSISMVMKTLRDADNGAVLHPTLKVPPGLQGNVQTEVEFQVTTRTPSLSLLLGSSASLHCGFSMAPGLDLTSVVWRLQYKGSGRRGLHLPDHHLSVPSSTNHPTPCPSFP